MTPIRVVIVDRAAHLRSALKAILDSTPDFEYAGSAIDSKSAMRLIMESRPDVVLMNLEEPFDEGLEATRVLAEMSPHTKIIAWSDHEEASTIAEIIAVGAFGYLLKRTMPEELLESLRWAFKGQSVLSRRLTAGVLKELSRLYRAAEERAGELHRSYLSTVDAFAAALETKDDQTGNHARRVRDYAKILTQVFKPSLLERESLEFGFLLHDLGKIGIPENILMKPGPLDDSEWNIMRQHPEMGARILGSIDFLVPDALDIVLSHHERWDGAGYPHRLEGQAIPIGARIFSVVDAFDAMTSDRPYRNALPLDHAVEEIKKSGGSQFDPLVVDAFIDATEHLTARMAQDALVA